MNVIRKFLCFVLAIGLGAFALPGMAAVSKSYSLVMAADPHYTVDTTSGTTTIQAPVTVLAKITNESPPSDASSNISSFSLTLTVPGVTIDSVEPFGVVTDSNGNVINGASGQVVRVSDTLIQVTGMSPLKGKQTFRATIHVTSCGDAKWGATVYTGSQLTGQTFNRVNDASGATNLFTIIPCGMAACGSGFSVADTTASANPFLIATHGSYNKDGSCGGVNYFVSNMLVTSGQVHFRWPVSGVGAQPNAVFAYEVILPNDVLPKVAWKNATDGSLATQGDGTATPAYIDAPTCLSGDLPAPYGSLSQSVGANTGQLKVNTSPSSGAVISPPSTFPFPIVIGSERMDVLGIQGSTWTVSRPTGNTQAKSHASNSLVMSTPLATLATTPIATLANGTVVTSPYAANDQTQICRVSGPTAVDGGGWSTMFIDIGDAWVRVGQ